MPQIGTKRAFVVRESPLRDVNNANRDEEFVTPPAKRGRATPIPDTPRKPAQLPTGSESDSSMPGSRKKSESGRKKVMKERKPRTPAEREKDRLGAQKRREVFRTELEAFR